MKLIGKATENFDKFEFGVAGHILYNFIWDEFADWYVELTKEVLYSDNEEEKVIPDEVVEDVPSHTKFKLVKVGSSFPIVSLRLWRIQRSVTFPASLLTTFSTLAVACSRVKPSLFMRM